MKTYNFINLHTKETRAVGGLRDLAHAWNIAEAMLKAYGWSRIDLIIKEAR